MIIVLNGLQSKQDSFYEKIRLDWGSCDGKWSYFLEIIVPLMKFAICL